MFSLLSFFLFCFYFPVNLMSCVSLVILSDHHHGVDACLYYMTSFNYGGKKARDVLTCRCNLRNVMPESIFYDRMGWRMTQLLFLLLFFCFLYFFFLGVVMAVFLSIEEMDSVLSL